VPKLSLENALELTLLVARKDARRHQRVAARWLLRYLEEDPRATVEAAALGQRLEGGGRHKGGLRHVLEKRR
jgi:hypothetical protein